MDYVIAFFTVFGIFSFVTQITYWVQSTLIRWRKK